SQDTATTTIDPLPLHDALPISDPGSSAARRLALPRQPGQTSGRHAAKRNPSYRGRVNPNKAISRPYKPLRDGRIVEWCERLPSADRKSTRLNSSHVKISYAVFC